MDFLPIYDEFYCPVRNFIAAMVKDEWVADDLVQETFLKVRKKMHTLNDKSKIKSWIFSIARNLCRDHFRKTTSTIRYEDQTGEKSEGLQPPLVQIELEQREMSLCVEDKINRLPESHKEVLAFSDTMDLSRKEIAEILGISVANVKIRLHRARKALKDILEQDCVFEHDERNVMVCQPK